MAAVGAEDRLLYGDAGPEEESLPDLDVERIKVGDREIQISSHVDLRGPKDERGLSLWMFTARDDHFRTVAEGYDRDAVIRTAFAQHEGSPR